MIYGFNDDKSKVSIYNKSEIDGMPNVSMPDFSYSSQETTKNFDLNSGAGEDTFKSYDIQNKGWYVLDLFAFVGEPGSYRTYLYIGDTSHEFNSNNLSYFHKIMETHRDNTNYRDACTLIVPLEAGDRIGVQKPSSGSILYLHGEFIPMK